MLGDMGWWAISGETLMAFLRRANEGEHPDVLYLELVANAAAAEDVEGG